MSGIIKTYIKKEDAQHYIARLSAIDVKMAQIMDGLLICE